MRSVAATKTLLLWLGMALVCAGAWSHALQVFAMPDGESISGYAYFSGAGRARNAEVRLETQDGEVLARTVTDDRGEFSLPIAGGHDHVVVCELPDGHGARVVVHAADLINDWSLLEDADTAREVRPPAGTPSVADMEQLERLVARQVERQVRPLREQVDGLAHKTRLRDILGGIGYIVGVAGLVLFLKRPK